MADLRFAGSAGEDVCSPPHSFAHRARQESGLIQILSDVQLCQDSLQNGHNDLSCASAQRSSVQSFATPKSQSLGTSSTKAKARTWRACRLAKPAHAGLTLFFRLGNLNEGSLQNQLRPHR